MCVFYLEVFGEMISNLHMRYLFKFVYLCFFEQIGWQNKRKLEIVFVYIVDWYRTCPPRHRYITPRQKSLHFKLPPKTWMLNHANSLGNDRSVVRTPIMFFSGLNHPWDWYIHYTNLPQEINHKKKNKQTRNWRKLCGWLFLFQSYGFNQQQQQQLGRPWDAWDWQSYLTYF